MKHHLLTLLIGLTIAAGGCMSGAEYQPPAEPVSIPARSFMKQWSYDLNLRGERVAALYAREDVLTVQTTQNNVYIIARDSGTLRFVKDVTTRNDRLFPPVLTDQWIIFPTHTALKLYDRRTGSEETINVDVSISTPAVYGDERLYFGTDHGNGGRIIAVDPESPLSPIVWRVMTEGAMSAAPVFHTDVVYFGGQDDHVYAVSSSRGQVWAMEGSRFDARGKIEADLAIDDFALYVPVVNGVLYALDRSTGKVKWQFFGEGQLRTPPVAGQQFVFQYVPGTGLVAIDKIRGEFTRSPRWVLRDGVQFLSEDRDRVYVRTQDNQIVAVNKENGEVVFRSQRNDFRVFATNTIDSTIYAATLDGNLYAITPVLQPGQVGELVLMETELGPLASR